MVKYNLDLWLFMAFHILRGADYRKKSFRVGGSHEIEINHVKD